MEDAKNDAGADEAGSSDPGEQIRVEVGPALHCGAFLPGHEVHYIQWGVSERANEDVEVTVTAVDDDGTIHFADGTTAWNHEPARLRRALERADDTVRRGACELLKVPHSGGGCFAFYLAKGPTPCPAPAPEATTPGELVDQLKQRGGFTLSGKDVLAMIKQLESEEEE